MSESSLTTEQSAAVAANLGLVYREAYRYRRRRCPIDLDTLVSDGWLALCQCVRIHDPARGSLASYAVPSICRAMADAIRRADAERQRFSGQAGGDVEDESAKPRACEAADDAARPVPDVDPAEAASLCRRYLATLTPAGRKVLTLWFGLGGREPLSLGEVAGKLGQPHSRVRSVARRAVAELRRRAMDDRGRRAAA